MEERYLTVTALTKYIKYKFDHDHNLEEVLLEGEVSNFKHNSRGHFYFTLKDENAQISATILALPPIIPFLRSHFLASSKVMSRIFLLGIGFICSSTLYEPPSPLSYT